MSYLRRTKATCGRLASKPNETDENPNYEDDTSIPLQDQIDNLRAKISLKEKYNKALMEEVSANNQGAAAMISELVQQNMQLRDELENEKNAEKFAVKKALRSYRLFQLAVQEKNVEGVINWLDDKIFDASKTLNEGIYLLKRMQLKIQEAEGQVAYLEMCPVPGTEPWEIAAEDNRIMLESAIENTKANRDAANLLNKKYKEILYFLKGEKGKWPYIMQSMEKTLAQLRTELASFEVMLEDAKRFRDEAAEKLKLTEEEASQNRKQRRQEMNKMKKSVERALEANTKKYASPGNQKQQRKTLDVTKDSSTAMSEMLARCQIEIKTKQQMLQDLDNRANKVVEAMRVRDLRYCPERLENVRKVGEVLTNELSVKEGLKELLLKHKYRLELILRALRYTGCAEEELFLQQCVEKEAELERLGEEQRLQDSIKKQKGAIIVEIRLGMIGLEELFNETKKRAHRPHANQSLPNAMKSIIEKVGELVKGVDELKGSFSENSKPQRSYAPYVKFTLVTRQIRIGAPEEMDVDDDSDQDVEVDSKIPSREEIKAKSERFHAQALLRRGVR